MFDVNGLAVIFRRWSFDPELEGESLVHLWKEKNIYDIASCLVVFILFIYNPL